ncbi:MULTISPECIES: hypothetical protein [unclassified Endozoicomonas]|uniref:hypothetical protein n=1 Tax=unclassified Endozoicomonas TaxID=2644528 RepID=UPI003BB71240
MSDLTDYMDAMGVCPSDAEAWENHLSNISEPDDSTVITYERLEAQNRQLKECAARYGAEVEACTIKIMEELKALNQIIRSSALYGIKEQHDQLAVLANRLKNT